jgi:hypothetical protein
MAIKLVSPALKNMALHSEYEQVGNDGRHLACPLRWQGQRHDEAATSRFKVTNFYIIVGHTTQRGIGLSISACSIPHLLCASLWPLAFLLGFDVQRKYEVVPAHN